MHVRNVGGPVYDLPTTMTKLLACGMSLADVIGADECIVPVATVGNGVVFPADGQSGIPG